MRKRIFLPVITFAGLILLLPATECISHHEDGGLPEINTPEESTNTATTSIQSVLGDVNVVYPVVPDDGKTAGQVTMPAATTTTTKTTTTAMGTFLGANFTATLTFAPTDPATEQIGPKSYGYITLTVKAAAKDTAKVSLTGPDATAVADIAWHEVYVETGGEGTTSWKILTPGKYVAEGFLLNPAKHDFSVSIQVP